MKDFHFAATKNAEM